MRTRPNFAVFMLIAAMLAIVPAPGALALGPATWSHGPAVVQAPRAGEFVAHYDKIGPADCTHPATIPDRCSGTDTTYGSFSYATPKSYGIHGSCDYPCLSQDVFVNYPFAFTHGGKVYQFARAQQEQCAQGFGCSTETSWTTAGPVDVPYSGTPAGRAITVDTLVFYKDPGGSDEVEVEFTYGLDEGYG